MGRRVWRMVVLGGIAALLAVSAVPRAAVASNCVTMRWGKESVRDLRLVRTRLMIGMDCQQYAIEQLSGPQTTESILSIEKVIWQGYVEIRAAHATIDFEQAQRAKAISELKGKMLAEARTHIIRAHDILAHDPAGTAAQPVRVENAINHLQSALALLSQVLRLP